MTSPTNALSDNYPPFDSYPHVDDCKCADPYLDFACLGLTKGMTIGFKDHNSEEIFTQTIGRIEQDERTGTITILTDHGDEPAPDVTPLSVRMLEAADTLEAVSRRSGHPSPEFGKWSAAKLRRESENVAAQEADE